MSEVICPSCNTPMEEKPACTFPQISHHTTLVYACVNPGCPEEPIYGFLGEEFADRAIHLHCILDQKTRIMIRTGLVLLNRPFFQGRILSAHQIIERVWPSYNGANTTISCQYPSLVPTIFFRDKNGDNLGFVDCDTVAWLEYKGVLLIGPHDQINKLRDAIDTINRHTRHIPEIA